MKNVRVRMTGRQYAKLRAHLFPGDGKEAVAVALCGRVRHIDDELVVVHRIELVPHSLCDRHANRIKWPPTIIEPLLREAAMHDLAIAKIHSHPLDFPRFSVADDESDRNVFESVFGWIDSDRPHTSLIMLPDGGLIGRAIHADGTFSALKSIAVVGDDVRFWSNVIASESIPEFAVRHAQLFGDGTTTLLRRLRIAVVGCSGTGSVVVEQLARLGVGHLILVDPDRVEHRNLNRIVGARRKDAEGGAFKVEVLARNIDEMGLETTVKTFPTDLEVDETIRAVSTADFVIGCMDGLRGRHLLCRLARYYLLPYVDVGVKLEALQDGTINQVAGSVHYFQPDGLDFLDRGIFSAAALESEALFYSNREAYQDRLARGYVRGVVVERPAVISVNMLFASLCVNEVLARLHPFRMDSNAGYATTRFSISHFQLEREADGQPDARLVSYLGRGDAEPLLGMPSLGECVAIR